MNYEALDATLMACPLCGANRALVQGDEGHGWWYVICDGCGLQTSEVAILSPEEAAARWNCRDGYYKEVDRLRFSLREIMNAIFMSDMRNPYDIARAALALSPPQRDKQSEKTENNGDRT